MPASPETEPTGEALWLDVERFAHDQLHADTFTPESLAERAKALTERWRGTLVALNVLDGGVPIITRDGETDVFTEAEGAVESVTVGGGGGVEVNLDDGSCLSLPLHGSLDSAPEDCKSGWTATVSSIERAA